MSTRSSGQLSRMRRGLAWVEYCLLTAATAALDIGPARVRFGHARTLSRMLFGRHTPASVDAADPTGGDPGPTGARVSPTRTRASGSASLHVALVTASLDVGGVETVVATLARLLPVEGIEPIVLVLEGGRTAKALRAEGVEVREVPDEHALLRSLQALDPDVVEVHTATPAMGDVLASSGLPLVSVLHSVELYRSLPGWEASARLDAASHGVIAVSRTVREDHVAHVPTRSPATVTVVPNGADAVVPDARIRSRARARVAAAVGLPVAGSRIALCLARYDIQKNVVGLVDAFALAASRLPDVHLVVAGGISDWMEHARADALRRSTPAAERVHLLRESDAATLLDAADLFVIDSFFEGWPVAVTEAICRGLPVVMADVGGAQELLAADGGRGLIVPNPAGDPVTARTVAAARRRLHQRQRAVAADAIVEVAGWERTTRPAPFDHSTMVAGHADVFRDVARSTRPEDRDNAAGT